MPWGQRRSPTKISSSPSIHANLHRVMHVLHEVEVGADTERNGSNATLDLPHEVTALTIRSSSALYAKPPPTYEKLPKTARRAIDSMDLRHARPSQLKALGSSLAKLGLISDAQKLEFEIARKPYAADNDDSAFDFVASMEAGAVFAASFEKSVPGTGCASYYKGMVQFTHWIQETSDMHRKYRPFSAWA